MASAKQRNRALKRKNVKMDMSDLSPRQQQGITQGSDEHRLLEYYLDPETGIRHKILDGESGKVPDGIKAAQHMNTETYDGTRAPRPHFVAIDDPYGVIRQDEFGRRMMDVNIMFTRDMMEAVRSGMLCLKCLEPQSYPFEDFHLKSCEGRMVRGPRYMRDWQITDIAMEFEGDTHVGPQKPLAEYEAEMEEKRLKRKFDEQIVGGKSPMKGLRRG